MRTLIGIRREDKNPWERRVPLIPEHVESLVREHGVDIRIQPSAIRAFSDEEYADAGAQVVEDLSACPVVLAVKEFPIDFFLPGRTYVCFSHTLKGQPYNMPRLGRMMELGCQLIDYERIVDASGRRLVFFGRFAGLAGMTDTLWALGRRLELEGIRTPLTEVRRTVEYKDLHAAKEHMAGIGRRIAEQGLPDVLVPLVVGFAGYGNVSGGGQEMFDLLPHEEVSAAELRALFAKGGSSRVLYKAVFREEDTATPRTPDAAFDLQDFRSRPEKYRSRFDEHLPYLTVLLNCIYWEPGSPRLVTREALQRLFCCPSPPRLRVIGDISCDIGGAVDCTVRCSDCGDPVYVYDPLEGSVTDGVAGRGPVILAVDNLPCELPAESSRAFSEALMKFAPAIAAADFSKDLYEIGLPPEVRKAVILHRGKLTPAFSYLAKYVQKG